MGSDEDELETEIAIDAEKLAKYKRIKVVLNISKGSVDSVLRVLKPAERKVFEVILKQKEVTTVELRLKTNFSKLRLWRLLRNLEERNLIVKEQQGRIFKIKLADWLR